MVDIDRIYADNPIESVAERITGMTIDKNKLRCPFHADDTPSLHIYPDGKWKCYGCGKFGDIIDFVGYFRFGDNYNSSSHFLDVVDWLGGLDIRKLEPSERTVTPTKQNAKTTFSMDSVKLYHVSMSDVHRNYWHGRGLTDETIDAFLLGWNGHRLTIPVTYRNVCYAIKKRQWGNDDGAKYIMEKGSRVGIFNADVLLSAHSSSLPVFIVEGEIEAMLLDQMGFPAVSATGGAGTWRTYWSRFFADIPRIAIIYDNDEPGRDGALNVRASLHRAEIWQWPSPYHDGGEFLPTDEAWNWLMKKVEEG